MKKIIAVIALIAFIGFGAIAAPRKKTSSKKTTPAALTVKKGEIKNYGDVLETQTFTLDTKRVEYKIEYPMGGSQPLVNAIREYIKEIVDENYTGSLDSPEGMMKASAKKVERGQSSEIDISVIYNGPNSISVSCYISDMWEDAAHPHSAQNGKTFRKSDGLILSESMLPPVSKLKNRIKAGLAKYSGISVSEVDEYYYPNWTEEYPATIMITDNGLSLRWNPYEIASYSVGMPSVDIPLDNELLQLLSPEAKTFF